MAKRSLRSARDFEEFFQAYNEHDWDKAFTFLTDDCVWDAAERCCQGIEEAKEYWCGDHSSIAETLGKPRNVVFSGNLVYLEVPVHMEFLEEGQYFGKSYKKGESLDFWCADIYILDERGTIKQCRVYSKFD